MIFINKLLNKIMLLLSVLGIINISISSIVSNADTINIVGNQASDAIVKNKDGQIIPTGEKLNKYIGYNV